MTIKILNEEFAVCKVMDYSMVDFGEKFVFTGKTDDENSLVCSVKSVPDNVTECDKGWRGFRIEGVLDFSLIGILAKISKLLAENEIGIFVVSTYNTDYIFTKNFNFEKAVRVLESNGYKIIF